MSQTALIFGATGLVGSHLLENLLNSDNFSKVYIVARRKLADWQQLNASSQAKMEFVQLEMEDVCQQMMGADKDPLSLGLPQHVDQVFCCLGTTIKSAGSKEAFRRVDVDYVYSTALYAKYCQAKGFFWISAAVNSLWTPSFHLKLKAVVDRKIQALELPYAKAVCPSLIEGKREAYRPAESISAYIMQPFNKTLLNGPLRIYKSIQAVEIAQAMLNLALNRYPVHPYLRIWPNDHRVFQSAS